MNSETPLPVKLTLRERELIMDLLSVDEGLADSLAVAAVKRGRVEVRMNAYDLDELLGAIAADANHCEVRKLQKELDALFRRLSRVLDTKFPRD